MAPLHRRHGPAVLGQRAPGSAGVVQPLLGRPRSDGQRLADRGVGAEGPGLFPGRHRAGAAGAARVDPESAAQVPRAGGPRTGGADHQPLLPSDLAVDRRSWDRPYGAAGPRHAATALQASRGCRRTAPPRHGGPRAPLRSPATRRLAARSRRVRRRPAPGR